MIHKQKVRRSTRQRRLILDALKDSINHPSPSDIYATLADSGIGIATIYRQLSALVEDGEILIFGENIFNYQDIIKELKLMSAQNIGELKLRLEGMKNLCELKPVRLHAKPNKK